MRFYKDSIGKNISCKSIHKHAGERTFQDHRLKRAPLTSTQNDPKYFINHRPFSLAVSKGKAPLLVQRESTARGRLKLRSCK